MTKPLHDAKQQAHAKKTDANFFALQITFSATDSAMTAIGWYIIAAMGEIAGCFAFWAWLRLGKSPYWLIAGVAALVIFAIALTRVDSDFAGRAYAAYGGVYIFASILWLWFVERQAPDRFDLVGSAVALAGTAIILFSPRGS